jgi:hypothetical protein
MQQAHTQADAHGPLHHPGPAGLGQVHAAGLSITRKAGALGANALRWFLGVSSARIAGLWLQPHFTFSLLLTMQLP